ncbi:MBL fold metallo-hydrolase [Candidatus Saccharibacteria bacterium]|nr:MBL fold metallo-hydrolase [Candidatus Saccharibacteria bacterium]
MKITKYEHSCLSVEVDGRILVIDPGVFSTSFTASDNIDAVVVTHEHPDHFDPEKITQIRSLNPNVVVFTTDKVAQQIPDAKVPNVDEKVAVGSFDLQFFGHDHAPIIPDVVPCDNIGVVVNGVLAYPGDSFAPPPIKPQILALPVSAPWLKVYESMKYIAEIKPGKVFPTHNALLSEIGQDITYAWIHKACDEASVEFIDLQPGQELTI